MSEQPRVPEETLISQRRAADPAVSAWVSANAGSGKTHVLASRVIRLLLGGTDPAKILCLTYTKAAASNMANRIFQTLGVWTVLEDADLAYEIEAIEGREAGSARLTHARRLFARALETPGGLKIQTIHAFCEALLHRFPLEANIAGHFELVDERMETALVAEARRDLLTGATADTTGALGAAFAAVLALGGESGLDTLLGEIVGKRDALRAFIDQATDGKDYPALYEEFGFDAKTTEETIAAAAWPLPGCDAAYLREIDACALEAGAVRARESFSYAAVMACDETRPVQRIEALATAFLSGKRDAYKPDWLFSKAMRNQLPDLAERYLGAAAFIIAALDRLALFRMIGATSAALTIADHLIGRYETLKRARGLLDFNDLIMRTSHLLKRRDAGPWVQYKLDQGIDHVLVDEAQDTSPAQWDVVERLTGEFFTGEGARSNILRTIFAVGDEKQSIYSFQGADPYAFEEMRDLFRRGAGAADKAFVDERLPYSFRSTPDVLSAVDLVFAADNAKKGLTRDLLPVEHRAVREADPGHVELWPSIGAEAIEEPKDWREAIDHAAAPAVKLADAIAQTIRRWIDTGEALQGRNRQLSPGDIMVLVRKRDSFIHALARRLKELDIPVAGADRLSLPGHIAVKDLIAIGRFVLQPHDDLSLAAVLKSPVFGLDDEALMTLSIGRPDAEPLWARLRDAARADSRFAKAGEQLAAWRRMAGFGRAADFYAGLLGRDGLRRKMIARLGPEAGDILDEFMNFALAEERTGSTDLESFLTTLSVSGPDIRRQMDQKRAEVRIMTVHAAKGLEAPVVFLVDSGGAPFTAAHMPRLVPISSKTGTWTGKGFLWNASKALANPLLRERGEEIAEKAEEEYRRLLYVGMTRAEDRLIVCGYHGKTEPKDNTWHQLVRAGLEQSPDAKATSHPTFAEPIFVYQVTEARAMSATPTKATSEERPKSLPFDMERKLPTPPDMPRPLSPSGAALLIEPTEERDMLPSSPILGGNGEPSLAIRRGTAMHTLLQMLPELDSDTREEAARDWLQRTAADWPDGERERLLSSALAILADPAYASVFAAGSRAEVTVMGTVPVRGRQHTVSGKIDRIAVTDTDVLLVDYKTSRPAPASLQDVSDSHIIQLALYRALLAPLYPGRAVRCALLYTEAPRLIGLPADVMNAALARLSSA